MGRIIIPMRRQPREPVQQTQYARPNVEAPIDTINKWAPLVRTTLDVGVAGGSRLLGALNRSQQAGAMPSGAPMQPQGAPQDDLRAQAMGIIGQNQGTANVNLGGDPLASIAAQRYGQQPDSGRIGQPTPDYRGMALPSVPDSAPQPPRDADLMGPNDMLPPYLSTNGVQFPAMNLPNYQQQLQALPANVVKFGDSRPQGPEGVAMDAARNAGLDSMNAQRGLSQDAQLASIAAQRAPQASPPEAPIGTQPLPQRPPMPTTTAQPGQFGVQAGSPQRGVQMPKPDPRTMQMARPVEAPQATMPAPVGADPFAEQTPAVDQAQAAPAAVEQQPQRGFSGPVSMANLRAMAAEAGRTGNETLAREVMQKFVEADDLDVYPDNFMDWVTGSYQTRAQQELAKLMDPGGSTLSPLQQQNIASMIEARSERAKTERESRPGKVNQAIGKGQTAIAQGAQAPAQQAAKTMKAQADGLIAQVKAAYAPILEGARAGNAEAIAQKNVVEARLAQKLEEMGVPQAQEVAKLALTKAQTTAALMNAGSNRMKAQSYAAWVAKYTPYIPKDINVSNAIAARKSLESQLLKAQADKDKADAAAAIPALDPRTANKRAQADLGRAGGAMLDEDKRRKEAAAESKALDSTIKRLQMMLDELPDQQ